VAQSTTSCPLCNPADGPVPSRHEDEAHVRQLAGDRVGNGTTRERPWVARVTQVPKQASPVMQRAMGQRSEAL